MQWDLFSVEEKPEGMKDPLQEAKELLRKNFAAGINCPCCGQLVKKYKRKLNSGMAITLIRIFNNPRSGEWINVKDFLRENKFPNSHDWTLLRYWGFLEERQEEGTSGEWRVTDDGRDFALNQRIAKKHLFLFDNRFYGWGEATTNILEALGDKFNYFELMRG